MLDVKQQLELNRFHLGDCRELMGRFPDDYFQTVVTSAPYWCARLYGVDYSMWGGDRLLVCRKCGGEIRVDDKGQIRRAVPGPRGPNVQKSRDVQGLCNKAEHEGQRGVSNLPETHCGPGKDMQSEMRSSPGDSRRQVAPSQPAQQLWADEHKLEGREKENEGGVFVCSSSAKSPDQGQEERQEEVHSGAQAGDGEASREVSGRLGEGPPQKRGKGRQQGAESKSRQRNDPQWSGSVSSLRGVVLDPLVCPYCGSSEFQASECNHDWTEELPPKKSNQAPDKKRGNDAVALGQTAKRGWFCRKCRGWIGALGLEPDPQLYVEHIVEVMQHVKRVLRRDGTVWLNIGDSYAATPSGWPVWNNWQTGGIKDNRGSYVARSTVVAGMKEKDLCLIPEQLALALRDDGWWLRSRITWEKDNPMPEGVKDRPTVCDERIWLLSKSQWYYYDNDAIREPQSISDREYSGRSGLSCDEYEGRSDGVSRPGMKMSHRSYNPAGRNKRTVWQFPTEPFRMQMCGECKQVYTVSEYNNLVVAFGGDARMCGCGSVSWLSHFATFPKRLVEPCILAGSSRMACPKCLAPWRRITEKRYEKKRPSAGNDARTRGTDRIAQVHGQHGWRSKNLKKLSRTAGWQPTCDCEANDGSGRCIILDPFMGTGTTAVVASYLGRDWIGIEANKDYIKLAERRLELEGSQLVMSYT